MGWWMEEGSALNLSKTGRVNPNKFLAPRKKTKIRPCAIKLILATGPGGECASGSLVYHESEKRKGLKYM